MHAQSYIEDSGCCVLTAAGISSRNLPQPLRFFWLFAVLSTLAGASEYASATVYPEFIEVSSCPDYPCESAVPTVHQPDSDLTFVLPEDADSKNVVVDSQGYFNITIDMRDLAHLITGEIPIKFQAKSLKKNNEFLWHPWSHSNSEPSDDISPITDEQVNLTVKLPQHSAGHLIEVRFNRVDHVSNLSSIVTLGAEAASIYGLGYSLAGSAVRRVTMSPVYFMESVHRWAHLIFGLELNQTIHKLLGTRAWADGQNALSKCLVDIGEAATVVGVTQYGNRDFMAEGKSHHIGAGRAFMGTTPTNRVVDCMSSVVEDILVVLLQRDETRRLFADWQYLETVHLDRQIIQGISKVLVSYLLDFNIKHSVAMTSSAFSWLYSRSEHFDEDVKNAFATSIQYTLFSGYETLFTGLWKTANYDDGYAAWLGSVSANMISIGEVGLRTYWTLHNNPRPLRSEALSWLIGNDYNIRQAKERLEASMVLGTTYLPDSGGLLAPVIRPAVRYFAGNPNNESSNALIRLKEEQEDRTVAVIGNSIDFVGKSALATLIIWMNPAAMVPTLAQTYVATLVSGLILNATFFDFTDNVLKPVVGGAVQYVTDGLCRAFNLSSGSLGSYFLAGESVYQIEFKDVSGTVAGDSETVAHSEL